MKTDIFNFNRLGLLFQRHFAERLQSELVYWSIMVAAFMFIRNVAPLMTALILIAGIFYTSRFFREIHSPKNGAAFFMIPATQLEKLTAGIVMTTFYYFAMMLIAYIIGNLLGTFLNNILATVLVDMHWFSHSSVQWKLFEIKEFNFLTGFYDYDVKHSFFLTSIFIIFMQFLFIQPICLLGSIYFRRNQAFVTTLSVIISFLVIFAVFTLVLYLTRMIFGTLEIVVENYHYEATWLDDLFTKIFKYTAYTFLYLIPPFLLVVSYFRLTEKEV